MYWYSPMNIRFSIVLNAYRWCLSKTYYHNILHIGNETLHYTGIIIMCVILYKYTKVN